MTGYWLVDPQAASLSCMGMHLAMHAADNGQYYLLTGTLRVAALPNHRTKLPPRSAEIVIWQSSCSLGQGRDRILRRSLQVHLAYTETMTATQDLL